MIGLRTLPTEEKQGLAIWASHGVADAGSTLIAAAALGAGAEKNPLMSALLAEGYGFAAGVMLAVVGAISVSYPTLAKRAEIPTWFGWGISAVGFLLALLNLLKVGGLL